jgi:hypothetical protein
MSALGQKPTYAPQKAMSALPPIATTKADIAKHHTPDMCAAKLKTDVNRLSGWQLQRTGYGRLSNRGVRCAE